MVVVAAVGVGRVEANSISNFPTKNDSTVGRATPASVGNTKSHQRVADGTLEPIGRVTFVTVLNCNSHPLAFLVNGTRLMDALHGTSGTMQHYIQQLLSH